VCIRANENGRRRRKAGRQAEVRHKKANVLAVCQRRTRKERRYNEA